MEEVGMMRIKLYSLAGVIPPPLSLKYMSKTTKYMSYI